MTERVSFSSEGFSLSGILALDVARFGDPAQFRAEVDRLVDAVRALPRDPAVAEILVPGERGDRVFGERSRSGIPIPHGTYDELRRIAERFGVTMFGSILGSHQGGSPWHG